jgi:nucleotide-binding universal stress UspA family protein
MMPLFSKMKTSLLIAHVYGDFLSYRFKSSDAVATFQSHEKKLIKSAEAFVSLARKKHVKANFKLIPIGMKVDSSEALLQLGTEFKTDLIALAAKSSPIRTALAGALTRKLARNANCPVLVHRIK